MKNITSILATAFISAALLAGCKKEDNMPAPGALTTANAAIGSATGRINYKLELLLPPAGGGIRWNSGTMTENQLAFEGTHVFGDMLQRYEYLTTQNSTWDMFGLPDIGAVNVGCNFYRSASFQVRLGAAATARETATSGSALSAFSLNGTFRDILAGDFISKPVVFIVSQPVVLQTGWINSVTIGQTNYLATLSLDLSGVTNGVTNSMLAAATVTSGTIYITATSNTDIYNIMVANLNADVMNVQLSAQQSNIYSAAN